MIKFTKIVEEDEDGDDEDYKLQFIQNELQMKQFFMDEPDVPNDKQSGVIIKQTEIFSDQKELSSSVINSQSLDNSQNINTKRHSLFAVKQTSAKAITKNNEENSKVPRISICNDSSSISSQSQKTPTNNPQQQTKNQNNKLNLSFGFERPKTAKDNNNGNKLNDDKVNYSPKYKINNRKVPKETFFAYRSLSPTILGSSSSSLSQNSAQFVLSKNSSNCGRQLMKLANEGILNKDIVVQYEKEKQFIQDIDKKVLHSIQSFDITKKAIQTAPNFYKNEQKEIANLFQDGFKIKKHDGIIKTNQFLGERSNSLSPPKKQNQRHLPYRIVALGDQNNNNLTKKWQHPKSLERIKDYKQIEKQVSPSSKIEEVYLKAMKIIEKKHERHDLTIKAEDVQFNDQYLSVLKCSDQVKTPVDIVDSEFIYCNLYALAYNAYFIPIFKRPLPCYVELILHSGDIEIYAGKTEEPNLDHNDFTFIKFDIPNKINYQRGEVKDGVYMNIFLSSENVSNIPQKSNNIPQTAQQRFKKSDPQQTHDKKHKTKEPYKKQHILDQVKYNENRFRSTKDKDTYLVDMQRDEQKKVDFFLENRIKDHGNIRNIVQDNVKDVKKFSPFGRQQHFEKMRNDKQVKIIRAQYNKNLSNFKEVNKEILNIQCKSERKVQLIDADKRLENEVRLLKQSFQYRWLQVFVLIQIIKVFHAKMKAHKVKIARNMNLTSPIMGLNNLFSNFIKNKLGNDKFQRTYTRVHFCLKTRVQAFKPLMVHSASLVAGEFMQQKIKLMMIQSKMMIYYNHILMIQRSYRRLQKLREKMNEANIINWDLAIKIMLEDEQKFFDKSWIAKPVLVDFKKRLEKNKIKVLTNHVKQVQSQFFTRLQQYKEKLKKLPNSHQIAYVFCSKAFHSYFEKKYKKTIDDSYIAPVTKRTNEYYIETLKFMVKHNVYQLVNNPITAYEKEKQKHLEAQKKKNIEALRQKELLIQKQREEEFMQQKLSKNSKKNINVQEDQSVSSSSSLDSNGEPKKQQSDNPSSLKKSRPSTVTRSKQSQKKSTVVENNPDSFQDYLQQEEMQQEENNNVLKKLKNNKFDQQNQDLSRPSKLMEERIKKKIGKNNINQSFNSISNIEDSIAEDFESNPQSNQISKFGSKKNSVLEAEGDDFFEKNRNLQVQIKKQNNSLNEDQLVQNSPRVSIFFKKDKSPIKISKQEGNSLSESIIFPEKKNKQKKSPKKTVRINQDNDEINSGKENDVENQNEEDEEYEFEDNENYHEDIDNYLSKHHPMRKSKRSSTKLSKLQQQSRLSSSSKLDDETSPRAIKTPNNDEWSDHDDFSSISQKKKLISELAGLKSQKSTSSKKSKFKTTSKIIANLSSYSSHSTTSLNQLSQSNISSINGGSTLNGFGLNKESSSSINNNSNQNLINLQDQQTHTNQLHSLAATPNRTTKSKSKKKKTKKKKQINVEEGKLEEIVEGDEAMQTFWSNFIHQPIFSSYPNIMEMKELIIKLYKKL